MIYCATPLLPLLLNLLVQFLFYFQLQLLLKRQFFRFLFFESRHCLSLTQFVLLFIDGGQALPLLPSTGIYRMIALLLLRVCVRHLVILLLISDLGLRKYVINLVSIFSLQQSLPKAALESCRFLLL